MGIRFERGGTDIFVSLVVKLAENKVSKRSALSAGLADTDPSAGNRRGKEDYPSLYLVGLMASVQRSSNQD